MMSFVNSNSDEEDEEREMDKAEKEMRAELNDAHKDLPPVTINESLSYDGDEQQPPNHRKPDNGHGPSNGMPAANGYANVSDLTFLSQMHSHNLDNVYDSTGTPRVPTATGVPTDPFPRSPVDLHTRPRVSMEPSSRTPVGPAVSLNIGPAPSLQANHTNNYWDYPQDGHVNSVMTDKNTQNEALLDVYKRQLDDLKKKVYQIQTENKNKIEELKKECFHYQTQLAIKHNDNMTNEEVKKNLEDQVMEVEQELRNTRIELQEVQEDKKKLHGELFEAREELMSLSTKVRLLESGNKNHACEQQMDVHLRTIEEKHVREIAQLQLQNDKLTKTISDQEQVLRTRESRIDELKKKVDTVSFERTKTVNRLLAEAEQREAQLKELQAQVKQQPSLEAVMKERDNLAKELARAKEGLMRAEADVEHVETLLAMNVMLSNKEAMEPDPRVAAKVATLKQEEGRLKELARALGAVEEQRSRQRELKQLLNERDRELSDMQQREAEYQQAVTDVKIQYEEFKNQRKFSTIRNEEVSLLHHKIEILERRVSELDHDKQIVTADRDRLREESSELARQVGELQELMEQEREAVVRDHAGAYVEFHQRNIEAARQKIREECDKEITALRLKLEQCQQELLKVKDSYVLLTNTKEAALAEMDHLNDEMKLLRAAREPERLAQLEEHDPQPQELPTRDTNPPESEIDRRVREKCKSVVITEIQKAKEAWLQEEEAQRQAQRAAAAAEAERSLQTRLEVARAQWLEEWMAASSDDLGMHKLQQEVVHLKTALKEQEDRLTQKNKDDVARAWEYFQRELQETAELQSCKSAPVDKATTSEGQVTQLKAQLEQTREQLAAAETKYRQRLAEIQSHLQDKQREMEEFKHNVIKFSGCEFAAQKQKHEQEVAVLQKELGAVKEQLAKERGKCGEAEPAAVAKLRKRLVQFKEHVEELKLYYDRREELLKKEFHKKEERFFESMVQLKKVLDSLSDIEFPTYDFQTFINYFPTKDS